MNVFVKCFFTPREFGWIFHDVKYIGFFFFLFFHGLNNRIYINYSAFIGARIFNFQLVLNFHIVIYNIQYLNHFWRRRWRRWLNFLLAGNRNKFFFHYL